MSLREADDAMLHYCCITIIIRFEIIIVASLDPGQHYFTLSDDIFVCFCLLR